MYVCTCLPASCLNQWYLCWTHVLLIARNIFSPFVFFHVSPPFLPPFLPRQEWWGEKAVISLLTQQSEITAFYEFLPYFIQTCPFQPPFQPFLSGRGVLCVSFISVMLCNWPCGILNYLLVCATKDSVQPFQFHKQWKYRLTTELEFLRFAALGWPASGLFVFSTVACEGLAAISLGKGICLIDQTRTK